MELSPEQSRAQAPVVDTLRKRLGVFYEKHARINVADEVVTAFDRIATTFQSEKGKRMISSVRPWIPTVAKIGEGWSAAADLFCGVVGLGFGLRNIKDGIVERKLAVAYAENMPFVSSIMARGATRRIGVGITAASVIPTVSFLGRPVSRGALLTTRGVGLIGEYVGAKVDQMLMRSQEKQKKNIVFVASAKPV